MGKIFLFDDITPPAKGDYPSLAERTASLLLETKSVSLSPDQPFTWASGLKSPIYCDNRRLLSFPGVRRKIKNYFVHCLLHPKWQPQYYAIAAVATGAIPMGTLIADENGREFFYIRSEKKDHGKENLIEGALELLEDQETPIIIVEDLISTGGSSIAAAKAMQEKALVEVMIAVFSYNLPRAIKAFEEVDFNAYVLCNYPILIRVAVEQKYVTKEQEAILQEWNADPQAWSDAAEKRLQSKQ